MKHNLQEYFTYPIKVHSNVIEIQDLKNELSFKAIQTNNSFSEKWNHSNTINELEKLYDTQFEWFLKLYGFESEENLGQFLKNSKFIVDTGCGLGYKSYWFSKLAPQAIVFGVDNSESVYIASEKYKNSPNLFFIRADISNIPLKESICDFMVCDQVIMHTDNPDKTFSHLTNITAPTGDFACYFYSKKALPRELLDDHFRKATQDISDENMWELADQLTTLGKALSELNQSFICPDMPLLNIKGGVYDVQRFLYWNFLKCFWNPDWGAELSKITNYDWYSPCNAKRFSKDEINQLINDNSLTVKYWHEEEACFSGRFSKINK